MILDVLIRLQLPIENLRSQIHDGTPHMAGKFHGCQTEIKKHQPLARFVNCGAHVIQPVVYKVFQEAIVIGDALDECSSNFFHHDPLCTAKFFRDPQGLK